MGRALAREGTVEATQDGSLLRFERKFPAPPARVFEMVSTPAGLVAWYARVEVVHEVGGEVVEHHDHVGFRHEARVTRFDPPRAFGYAWGDTRGVPEGSLLWEVLPDGTGTRLRMTQRLRGDGGLAETLAGWHVCLDILEDVLAGGDPASHAPPRGTFRDGTFTPEGPARGRWLQRDALAARYAAGLASGRR